MIKVVDGPNGCHAWTRYLLIGCLLLGAAPLRGVTAHGTPFLRMRAQALPFRVPLPALYRQLEVRPGALLQVFTSRLAPDIHVAVVSRHVSSRLTFDLLRSEDAGVTWAGLPAEPWDHYEVAPGSTGGDDVLSPRWVRVGGVLTLVTMPGWISPTTLFVSEDLGTTWIQRDTPSTAACARFQAWHLVNTPAAPDRLLLAGQCLDPVQQDGPYLLASTDAGMTWTAQAFRTPGEPAWFSNLTPSATDADLLYRRLPTTWQRSRDLAISWEDLSIPGERLWGSPNHANVFAAVDPEVGEGLSSLDGGQTWWPWTQVPCGLSDRYGLVWLRGSSDTLLAACQGGGLQGGPLIRSHDGGQTWEKVSLPVSEQTGEPVPLPGGELTLIVADDTHAGGVYIQIVAAFEPFLYKLYRSLDEGDTWQDVLAFGWR